MSASTADPTHLNTKYGGKDEKAIYYISIDIISDSRTLTLGNKR